jgi:acid phosphatase (class A)
MSLFSCPPLPLLGFLLATTQLVTAADVSAHPKHEWNWLGKEDKLRLLDSIPPAPLPDSAQDKADLQGVLQLQASRTPADIAEARDDEKFRLEIVAGPLGPDFTAQKYPAAFALLERVQQDESVLNSTLKKEYKRLRPYEAHPEVKALFEVGQFSYPSGHTSGAYTLAIILGELFPEKKAAFLARAEAVGRSRIVAGVHYPSDVEQGKNLAQALSAALLANADFQRDLSAVKAEIAGQKIL